MAIEIDDVGCMPYYFIILKNLTDLFDCIDNEILEVIDLRFLSIWIPSCCWFNQLQSFLQANIGNEKWKWKHKTLQAWYQIFFTVFFMFFISLA